MSRDGKTAGDQTAHSLTMVRVFAWDVYNCNAFLTGKGWSYSGVQIWSVLTSDNYFNQFWSKLHGTRIGLFSFKHIWSVKFWSKITCD